jgi:hypothetical protein
MTPDSLTTLAPAILSLPTDPTTLTAWVGSIITALGIIITFFRKYFKPKKEEKLTIDLSFFHSRLDKLLEDIDKPNWKCINNYKTLVAKDMLRCKLRVIKKRIPEWVLANQNIEDTTVLIESFTAMIKATIAEYICQWKAIGVNPIIINSLINSNRDHCDYAIKLGIDELNRDYNNTIETFEHLLNSCVIPVEISVLGARNLMDSFNGQLKDDVYNGVKNTNEYMHISVASVSFES